MHKLQITEDIRAELTNLGIVICTYKLDNGDEVNCIDLEYQNDYPDLNIVDVVDFSSFML